MTINVPLLIMQLEPARILQAFFLLATIAALSVNSVPQLRDRLLLYGARQTSHNKSGKPAHGSSWNKLLDAVGGLEVPHSWFIHFYVTSVISSIFWGWQLLFKSFAVKAVPSLSGMHADPIVTNGAYHSSMTINQILLTWSFMTLQGSRRLYECIVLNRASSAKMPVFSWILGIAFYAAVGISVWIEGLRMLITIFAAIAWANYTQLCSLVGSLTISSYLSHQ